MVCIIINQWELKVKTSKLLEARENANDQVAIVFNFVSDCLRRWREFSWTSHRAKSSKAKPTSDFFRRSDEFFSDENCSKAWRTLRVKFPSSFVGVNLRPSGHLLNEALSLLNRSSRVYRIGKIVEMLRMTKRKPHLVTSIVSYYSASVHWSQED